MLKTEIPEESITQFDTVRAMAKYLAASGYDRDAVFSSPKSGKRKDKVLGGVTEAMLGRDTLSENFLFDCPRELEFDIARHTAENLSTPKELERLLKRDEPTFVTNFTSNPLVSFKISKKRHRMRTGLSDAMRGAIKPLAWVRHTVGESADLFSAPDVPKSEKCLIVGFSSRAMRLTTPTFHILCAIDPDQFDLLLLWDQSRQHYAHGVPGFGASVATAATRIAKYAEENAYQKTVALGTSSGAIPAICTAIKNRWPRVLACGSDRPSSHPHLSGLLETCAKYLPGDNPTEINLAYSGRRNRDVSGAAEIKKLFPSARLLPDQRFKDHALISNLQQLGELRGFLKANLTG